MENVLEIVGLRKQFPGFLLDNVSFSIPKGTIMGLIGENGAGKSTTINLILNELRADAGHIFVFGKDAVAKEKEVKAKIATIFDAPLLLENFTAREMGRIVGKAYPHWEQATYESLCHRFELPMTKVTSKFSRGMKVKLNFALALATRPELLILDEATAGLDPIVRDEVLDLLLDYLQDENCAILFSTHITSDLDKIADYITYLHKGRVLFSKPKDELLYDYGIIRCGQKDFANIDKADILSYRKHDFEYQVLVRNKSQMARKYNNLVMDNTTLEAIMLLYGRGEQVWPA
ncbi:MAG TPA: ABC transporter ATP-binding protein [Firmicutes bacterium]|nr:ABC transporter ATP-binding protein [Bacillota bacterium]